MVYNVGWSHDTNEENYLTVNHTIGQDKEKIQQISVFRISSRAPNLEGNGQSILKSMFCEAVYCLLLMSTRTDIHDSISRKKLRLSLNFTGMAKALMAIDNMGTRSKYAKTDLDTSG